MDEHKIKCPVCSRGQTVEDKGTSHQDVVCSFCFVKVTIFFCRCQICIRDQANWDGQSIMLTDTLHRTFHEYLAAGHDVPQRW